MGSIALGLANPRTKTMIFVRSAAALNKYPEILSKYLGKAAPSGETFIDLNTAFADDGAYISIKANQTVDKPIEIIYLTTEENGSTFSQARNLIVVEQNAEVQIVERHQNLGMMRALPTL